MKSFTSWATAGRSVTIHASRIKSRHKRLPETGFLFTALSLRDQRESRGLDLRKPFLRITKLLPADIA